MGKCKRCQSMLRSLSSWDRENDIGARSGAFQHQADSGVIFGGSCTRRDYWVYVPAQYDAARPANLMVCQDGRSYLDRTKAATVLDNLIAMTASGDRAEPPPTALAR